MIIEIQTFMHTLTECSDPNTQILEKLTQLEFPPGTGTHLPGAAVKAMAFSSGKGAVNDRGVSRYLTGGDVGAWKTTYKTSALNASMIMQQASHHPLIRRENGVNCNNIHIQQKYTNETNR